MSFLSSYHSESSSDSSVRILAIGDLHIQPDTLADINVFLKQLDNWLSTNHIDLIVILGDTLHTHETVYTECLNKMLEYIRICEKHATTEVLVGNHDFCFAPDTKVLMFDGTVKEVKDLSIGNLLMGDDSTPRLIRTIHHGTGRMYDVMQNTAETYTVNENHILVLKCGYNGHIFWNSVKKAWTAKWFSIEEKRVKSKLFSLYRKSGKEVSKEEAKREADDFVQKLDLTKIIEISVKDYLLLPKNIQERLYGYKVGVEYQCSPVSIDPWILGAWLGDGCKSGTAFASADLCIINKWEDWCHENNAELVHTGQYNYRIRKFLAEGVPSIQNSSCRTCRACKLHVNKYGRAASLACASIEELQLFLQGDSEIIQLLTKGASIEQKYALEDTELILLQIARKQNRFIGRVSTAGANPLRSLLCQHNLIHAKEIPYEYLVNDRKTRLAVLAGFIDTDGSVANDGRDITISQSESNMHMIDQIATLAKSLGFSAKVHKILVKTELNKNLSWVKFVNITGEFLGDIPTITPRKKCKNIQLLDSRGRKCIDRCLTNIKIVPSEQNKYTGFQLNGNARFLLKDFTVVHNCNNQQFLTKAHPFAGWKSHRIVDYVKVSVVKGKKIVLCPYVPDGRFHEALRTVGDEWRGAECIFAHQLFDGAKMGPIVAKGVEKWDESLPFVVSGHIHDKQRVQENLWYTGSSMQISFGEREDHTISLIHLSDESFPVIEEINIHPPTKKTVYSDISKAKEIKLPEEENVRVKVTLSGDSEEFRTFKKSAEYKKLMDKGVKVVFKQKRNAPMAVLPKTHLKSFPEILFSLIEENKDMVNFYNELFGNTLGSNGSREEVEIVFE